VLAVIVMLSPHELILYRFSIHCFSPLTKGGGDGKAGAGPPLVVSFFSSFLPVVDDDARPNGAGPCGIFFFVSSFFSSSSNYANADMYGILVLALPV